MKTVSAVAVLLLVAAGSARASDRPAARATLKGVTAMGVVVESIEPEIESVGLTRGQVQTDVELRLRQSGIRVSDDPTLPFLYVDVAAIKDEGLYAYSINAEFQQIVLVARTGTRPLAATWSTSVLGLFGRDNFSESVRRRVLDQIDRFINAFLSVNPKP